jgi:8-oxo-dGTP pyrophosphatase MutT (NUDIX family)
VERGDVAGDRVDFFATLCRELAEETGLVPDALEPESGWYSVTIGSRLPLIKIMRSEEVAATLIQRIAKNLAAQTAPEFREVVAVRDASALSDRMPVWVTAFLRQVWRPPTSARPLCHAGPLR